MVACCTSDAALGGPFLAKTRYQIACGRRKTASSPVWDLFSYGYKTRSLTTATRPGGRSAPAQRWRGCGRYVRTAWCCDGLTSATPSVDFSTPRSLCCSGGGVCRPPGRTSESRCSSNTAQTPTMLWRGHMLMILARLVCSESFWAVVKVRSPHNGREPGYPRRYGLCIRATSDPANA